MHPPILQKVIEKQLLSESSYRRKNGDGFDVWSAPALIEWAKDKGYPIFDLPVAGIPLSVMMFDVHDMDSFIYQVQRTNDTNLDHPIIIDDLGEIADGWHRVCKAILEKRPTVKAIRLEEMPEPIFEKQDDV